MWFTIVEPFGPESGPRWDDYCSWRGMNFERFDSVDRILRPSLFDPKTAEDWAHVVNADFMTQFITDLDYAHQKCHEISGGLLVGIEESEHNEDDPGFRGYDIVDGYYEVSLLTNWGNDVGVVNASIGMNGLIARLETAMRVQEYLVQTSGSDPHAAGCRILSVYDPFAGH